MHLTTPLSLRRDHVHVLLRSVRPSVHPSRLVVRNLSTRARLDLKRERDKGQGTRDGHWTAPPSPRPSVRHSHRIVILFEADEAIQDAVK